MRVFINEAITNGINCYLAKSQNLEYSQSHIFELKIIDILVHIYGKINIFNPYQVQNESSFKDNLMVYGADATEIDNLFSLLESYDKWLNSSSKEKNNNLKDIFSIIARLVILKNKISPISEEEMSYYQDFFNLKDNKIKQIVDMYAESRESVLNAWYEALDECSREPVTAKNLYLAEDQYEKYGIIMDDVKLLDTTQIKKLNSDILNIEEDDSSTSSGSTKENPLKLVLTSGNGFVDVLVLLSIICTEIMVGIIITVLIARF